VCREYLKGKYHCTIDLLFDWFGISCMTAENFCFYLQNRLIQTGQTGGQWYSDTSPFSIPCCVQIRTNSIQDWTCLQMLMISKTSIFFVVVFLLTLFFKCLMPCPVALVKKKTIYIMLSIIGKTYTKSVQNRTCLHMLTVSETSTIFISTFHS
jgi:hypothetical protein